jgi:hypothetical protein
MRYAHLAPGHKAQAVEKIAAEFHHMFHHIPSSEDGQEEPKCAKLKAWPRSSVG